MDVTFRARWQWNKFLMRLEEFSRTLHRLTDFNFFRIDFDHNTSVFPQWFMLKTVNIGN